MRHHPVTLLKSWRINKRVCCRDETGKHLPLYATVVAIDEDFAGFTVKWDHNCGVGWQPVEDICFFEAA